MAIAFGGFALLTGLALRYIRRTAMKLAGGREPPAPPRAARSALRPAEPHRFRRAPARRDRRHRPATDTVAAVLAIDLDHFKDINDTLGHHIGDGLIGVVAQRLVHAVRREDLVARLGGDEFAVITTEAPDAAALERFAERLIAILRAPYSISGHTLLIGASIGIAVIEPQRSATPPTSCAAPTSRSIAPRTKAAAAPASTTPTWTPICASASSSRTICARAIAEDGLSVAYQPIMNASGEKMAGVEALCRWHHPDARQRPAGRFHPDRRAQRADHSARRMGAAQGLPRGEALERADARGQRLAAAVPPPGFRRGDRAHPRRDRVRSRSGSSWS